MYGMTTDSLDTDDLVREGVSEYTQSFPWSLQVEHFGLVPSHYHGH